MLQHLLWGVLLEVNQLKQLDLVTLWGEDQLVLFVTHAHLEGDLVKDQIQRFLHLGHDLRASGVTLVVIHHLAQFCFHLGKGFPPVSVRSRKHSENRGREMPFLHPSISCMVSSSSGRASNAFSKYRRARPS